MAFFGDPMMMAMGGMGMMGGAPPPVIKPGEFWIMSSAPGSKRFRGQDDFEEMYKMLEQYPAGYPFLHKYSNAMMSSTQRAFFAKIFNPRATADQWPIQWEQKVFEALDKAINMCNRQTEGPIKKVFLVAMHLTESQGCAYERTRLRNDLGEKLKEVLESRCKNPPTLMYCEIGDNFFEDYGYKFLDSSGSATMMKADVVDEI